MEHRQGLTQDQVRHAFDAIGQYMLDRDRLGEIAVYGGAAIMLQFDWRRSTEDVDAVVTNGEESLLKEAVVYVGLQMGLPDDWLNNFVGAYTPEEERSAFFGPVGDFPAGGPGVGLRVFAARPAYLCAMKIKALERGEDRDFSDAVELARDAGVATEEGLLGLYASFFPDEKLGRLAAERLPSLAEAVAP